MVGGIVKSFLATGTVAMVAVLGTAPAWAQTMTQSVCQQNFVVEGMARVTAINFHAWHDFSNLPQPTALKNLRAAMLAEGFSNIGVDAEAGQTADSNYVRSALCRVVDAANLLIPRDCPAVSRACRRP